MRPRYRLTPTAAEGLRAIVRYVEERFGIMVAERVLDQLDRSMRSLSTNPKLGHRRQDLTANPRIRFWSVGPTLLAYHETPEGIEVLFIERGELDWARLLREMLD